MRLTSVCTSAIAPPTMAASTPMSSSNTNTGTWLTSTPGAMSEYSIRTQATSATFVTVAAINGVTDSGAFA